jgi:hypothetical protein
MAQFRVHSSLARQNTIFSNTVHGVGEMIYNSHFYDHIPFNYYLKNISSSKTYTGKQVTDLQQKCAKFFEILRIVKKMSPLDNHTATRYGMHGISPNPGFLKDQQLSISKNIGKGTLTYFTMFRTSYRVTFCKLVLFN